MCATVLHIHKQFEDVFTRPIICILIFITVSHRCDISTKKNGWMSVNAMSTLDIKRQNLSTAANTKEWSTSKDVFEGCWETTREPKRRAKTGKSPQKDRTCGRLRFLVPGEPSPRLIPSLNSGSPCCEEHWNKITEDPLPLKAHCQRSKCSAFKSPEQNVLYISSSFTSAFQSVTDY